MAPLPPLLVTLALPIPLPLETGAGEEEEEEPDEGGWYAAGRYAQVSRAGLALVLAWRVPPRLAREGGELGETSH